MTGFLLAVASLVLVWRNNHYTPVNFIVGDARDYYSYLISVFVDHNLNSQNGDAWYLLKTVDGTINVHTIGESVLLLPFFLVGWMLAIITGAELNGVSFPFQITVALAALTYLLTGLHYLLRLLTELGFKAKTVAVTGILLVFGTNLFNYTVFEPAMSHVYSFSLISLFLFFSRRAVQLCSKPDLFRAILVLGLITLLRPNNILVVFAAGIWFNAISEVSSFFKWMVRLPGFYISVLAAMTIVFIQNLVWFYQSGHFFHHTYKADGFYWFNPQVLKLLFGFDNGFFIYTPLCLVFIAGILLWYKQNRFAFWAALLFLAGLIYFFASYWAYTYFDGLGIRVMVDYYAFLAVIGARLTELVLQTKLFTILSAVLVSALVVLNLVYCYQNNRGILLRAGMTFEQWRYIFFKTGKQYQGCLGGANDLTPYAKQHPKPFMEKKMQGQEAFDYTGKEFGMELRLDSLGVKSSRLHFKIRLEREEDTINSSSDAQLVLQFEHATDPGKPYLYSAVKLNGVPSSEKSLKNREWLYAINVGGDFKPSDRCVMYIWNKAKQAFRIKRFGYKLYNYNYSIN
ncbi:MAG: hypothetical protein QM534_00955 [Sediminibacterium sp.]|nr:hypothetical protein [Sediminibacterium sp.]